MRPTQGSLALIAILGLWITVSSPAYAQIDLGAGIDVEHRVGGADSRFLTNEIASASQKPHFALHQVNLFAFSDIGEAFFFEGRLQIDDFGDEGLNPPRVGLAYLGWEPQNQSVSVSVGRLVNPFGLYPKQVLAFQHDFVTAPLLYGYGINVTQTLGYWPPAQAASATYTAWNTGLSTLYRGGYVTGAELSWTLLENTLVWDIAVVNTAPTSRTERTGSGTIAGITRVEIHPAVFWTQGLSVSHGSFMEVHPENAPLREERALRRFRQTLVGTDFRTGYGFFGLEGEVIYTIWSVPGFRDGNFVMDEDGEPVRYRLTQVGGHLDAKVEPPVLPGSYLALRGERLHFPAADDPLGGPSIEWDEDVTRLSVVVGYKLHPRILAKASFTEQTPFDGSRYSLRFQVTSLF